MARIERNPTSYRGALIVGGALLSSHCSLAFPVDDLAQGTGSATSSATTGTGGAPSVATTSTAVSATVSSSKAVAASVSSGSFDASTSASGSGGGSPIPTDALILHLDATPLALGDRLALWPDASPEENDATQGDLDLRPHVIERDGLRAVSFEGDGEHLRLPEGFADFSNGLSIFVVGAFEDGGNCPQLLQLTNGEEIDDVALWRGSGFGFEIADQWFEGSVPVASDAIVSYAARQDALGAVLLNHNTDLVGVETFMLPVTVPRTLNFVGSGLYPACASFHGMVHELLLYRRRLDDAEFLMVTGHLMQKWNVP